MYVTDEEFDGLRSVVSYEGTAESEALVHLAALIDGAGERGDLSILRRAVELGTSLLARPVSVEQSVHVHYCLGNAWGLIRRAEHVSGRNVWEWKQPEFEEELRHYRLAAWSDAFAKIEPLRRAQVLTNTGNLLSHVGRSLEAVTLYDAAEQAFPAFGMATGNRGVALCRVAQAHYDRGQECVVLHQAHAALLRAMSKPDHLEPGALEGFTSWKRWIEECVHPEFLAQSSPAKEFSLGPSEEERRYRTWCLERRLFLNPMNDAGRLTVAATDTLLMPGHVLPLGGGPGFFGMFNQIKQEYVAARLLLWEGVTSEGKHFADREVLLMDTLDYAAHCVAVEKVRTAFRMAYSLLDKLAFLLNKYFELGIKDNLVNLNRLWFKDGQPKKGLSIDLVNRENWPLRGLYWLARDLFDEGGFVDALEPEARGLKDLRDHLEHKYLKVHDDLWGGRVGGAYAGLEDQFAHSIRRTDFAAKSVRLLSLTRSAITYTALAVHREERLRAEARDPAKLVPPMILPTVDEDWKQ